MSAVQTSISNGPAASRPGMEYDCAFTDKVTKIAAEAIPFGAYVAFTAEEACELPDSGAEITNYGGGVALIDPLRPSGTAYVAQDPVRVMARGRCGVLNEATVAVTDAVYVRFTVTGAEQKGAFRADSDGGDAAIPTGIRWFKGGAAGLAIAELGVGGSAGAGGATGATGATGPTGPTGPTGS